MCTFGYPVVEVSTWSFSAHILQKLWETDGRWVVRRNYLSTVPLVARKQSQHGPPPAACHPILQFLENHSWWLPTSVNSDGPELSFPSSEISGPCPFWIDQNAPLGPIRCVHPSIMIMSVLGMSCMHGHMDGYNQLIINGRETHHVFLSSSDVRPIHLSIFWSL